MNILPEDLRAAVQRSILTEAGVQVTDVGGVASWRPGPDFDATKLDALK